MVLLEFYGDLMAGRNLGSTCSLPAALMLPDFPELREPKEVSWSILLGFISTGAYEVSKLKAA